MRPPPTTEPIENGFRRAAGALPGGAGEGGAEGKAGCAAGSGGYRGDGTRGDARPPMEPSPGRGPARPVLAWGTAEVAEWVSGLGFPQYQVRGLPLPGSEALDTVMERGGMDLTEKRGDLG